MLKDRKRQHGRSTSPGEVVGGRSVDDDKASLEQYKQKRNFRKTTDLEREASPFDWGILRKNKSISSRQS